MYFKFYYESPRDILIWRGQERALGIYERSWWGFCVAMRTGPLEALVSTERYGNLYTALEVFDSGPKFWTDHTARLAKIETKAPTETYGFV